MREIKYPNRIEALLADRSRRELAEAMKVTRAMVSFYCKGVSRPKQGGLQEQAMCAWLGQPWGRVLTPDEVWTDQA